jgi:hypothetical protein
LIGGAVAGVLSALPVINVGNACCCLWVVSGGVIAAYVMQQDQQTSLTPADGALVGLLAGIVGAVVALVVSIPIDLIAAPMQRAILERLRQSAVELPPELRNAIDDMINSRDSGGMAGFVVLRVASFFLSLFIGGAASAVGGLLGAAIFGRSSGASLAPPPPEG